MKWSEKILSIIIGIFLGATIALTIQGIKLGWLHL